MTSSYHKVANKKDLKEGSLLRVDVKDKPIVLAMVRGEVFAMDAVCSHEGGPLEDGTYSANLSVGTRKRACR